MSDIVEWLKCSAVVRSNDPELRRRYAEVAAEIERLTADKKHLLSKLDALSTVLELRWQDVERFEAENERLMAAIWRIDGINDNMANYNSDINAVTEPILRPELGCDQPGVAGEREPEGQREHRDLKANR